MYNHDNHDNLAKLDDDALHGALKRTVGHTNALTAQLLAQLGELEARGIYRERACSSLYTYCVYELRMSEDEAQRRCRAARLARQFPVLLQMLEDSSIHLTGILLLGPHLSAENHTELLGRARHRSKREIEHLVATIAPHADVPTRIVPLRRASAEEAFALLDSTPTPSARPRNTWAAYVQALAGPVRHLQPGIAAGQAPPSPVDVLGNGQGEARDHGADPELSPRKPPDTPTGMRYQVQFTADQAYLNLLEEARDLLQHELPDRNLVEVQRRALELLVEQLRRRKHAAAERPHVPAPATGHARHLPAALRRAVWQRDAGRCAYVDERGVRCRETAGLEFHHQQPYACGGVATESNIALHCRAHNALAAEHDFGPLHMQRCRRRGRNDRHRAGAVSRKPRADESTGGGRDARVHPPAAG